jgi:hypothetical protein
MGQSFLIVGVEALSEMLQTKLEACRSEVWNALPHHEHFARLAQFGSHDGEEIDAARESFSLQVDAVPVDRRILLVVVAPGGDVAELELPDLVSEKIIDQNRHIRRL